MFIKGGNFYFNKKDSLVFKNIKFRGNKQEDYKIVNHKRRRRAIIFNLRYNEEILSYEMFIDFRYKYMPASCIKLSDEKMPLLHTFLKSLKIIYNTLIKIKEYADDGINSSKLAKKFEIYLCIKNDNKATNFVVRTQNGCLYICVDKKYFNNVDSINYNNTMFTYLTGESVSGKIILENNVLSSGKLRVIYPKSQSINKRVEMPIGWLVQFYALCSNDSVIKSGPYHYDTYKAIHEPAQIGTFIKYWNISININYLTPISLLTKFIDNVRYISGDLEIRNEYDILKYV